MYFLVLPFNPERLIKFQQGKTFAEIHPHFLEFLRCKSHIHFSSSIHIKSIGSLHGIGKGNIYLPVEDGPCSCRLLPRDSKDTGIISKKRSNSSQQSWKFPAQLIVSLLNRKFRSIHKHIFLYRMSVQINIQIKPFFVFAFELFCKFHQVKSLRKGVFSRLVECSVEILSEKTGSVVSCNHPVRIQHRHHVEYIPFSQLFAHRIIAAYTTQHPLSHKRSI